MTGETVERRLEELHPASAGWALSCCRWDREEAEEVLQMTYLKILDGRARFDDRSSFKTWLFGVIRRTAAERRRSRWLRSLAGLRWRDGRPGTAGVTRRFLAFATPSFTTSRATFRQIDASSRSRLRTPASRV